MIFLSVIVLPIALLALAVGVDIHARNAAPRTAMKFGFVITGLGVLLVGSYLPALLANYPPIVTALGPIPAMLPFPLGAIAAAIGVKTYKRGQRRLEGEGA